jgi:hypothetical protein
VEEIQADLAGLRWPDITVHVTPGEPFEVPRPIQLRWVDGTFAIASEGEPDLRTRSVLRDGVAYVNQDEGMGWTRFGLDEKVPENTARFVLLDFPRLVTWPGLMVNATRSGPWLNATVAGSVEAMGIRLPVLLDLVTYGGEVRSGRLDSAAGVEAPYRFLAAETPFPFEPVPPESSLPSQEARNGNLAAHAGHVRLIRLIQNYTRTHAGLVPDEPSPESMQVELLTAGHPWPTNPFTGRPMAAGDRPGDFGWTKRGPREALYVGWGWDGALVSNSFRA